MPQRRRAEGNEQDGSMSRTGPHDQLPTVSEACAHEAQVLALSLTRFIAAGYMTQDVACWDAGCQCAEEALGPAHAPRLVAALIGVMRALRSEPQGPASSCRQPARVLTGGGAAPLLTDALQAAAE